MTNLREDFIKRNENFVQIPMPKLSEMTNEELERRANLLEKTFQILFDADVEDEGL